MDSVSLVALRECVIHPRPDSSDRVRRVGSARGCTTEHGCVGRHPVDVIARRGVRGLEDMPTRVKRTKRMINAGIAAMTHLTISTIMDPNGMSMSTTLTAPGNGCGVTVFLTGSGAGCADVSQAFALLSVSSGNSQSLGFLSWSLMSVPPRSNPTRQPVRRRDKLAMRVILQNSTAGGKRISLCGTRRSVWK